MKKSLIVFLLLITITTGCRQAETPPPADTTAVPTPTQLAPTAAVATQTLPPPPTVAAAATNTAVAEPTLDVPPGSTVLLTAADFGPDRNPLTGELVADPALLQRRPLAVKISNAPPNFVRPQSGLNDADIIFEHTAEGSVTRLTALFYDTAPPQIGPIRSARLIDLELPAMYDAALAFSGASNGVNQRLNSIDFRTRIIYSAEEGYFRSGEDKPFEHTLYGNPEGFWRALDAKGENGAPTFATFNAFSSEPPTGGESATYASINYQWELVEWRYDAGNGRYLRWAAGQPIIDANDGQQVSAANVIIIAPFHVEDPTICEEIRNDQCVHLSVQIQLWGSGTGLLLRDGQQFPITWHREARNDMLTFTDANGNPVPLQIGNSWVQLVPSWYTKPVTVSP